MCALPFRDCQNVRVFSDSPTWTEVRPGLKMPGQGRCIGGIPDNALVFRAAFNRGGNSQSAFRVGRSGIRGARRRRTGPAIPAAGRGGSRRRWTW